MDQIDEQKIVDDADAIRQHLTQQTTLLREISNGIGMIAIMQLAILALLVVPYIRSLFGI